MSLFLLIPNLLDILQLLGVPLSIIIGIAIVFLFYNLYTILVNFYKNTKVIEVEVIDDVALIYKAQDNRALPHALFKLKISNISTKPLTISDIKFETNPSLYNKAVPLENSDNTYFGIAVDNLGFPTGVGRSIRLNNQFTGKLRLEQNDATTVFVYFYHFLKIESNNQVELQFVTNEKTYNRKITVVEGMNPNAYLNH